MGSRYTYAANRDHLLWPAVDHLLHPREHLRDRVRQAASEWELAPLSIEFFGSVARGSADGESDIDVLILAPANTPDDHEQWQAQASDLQDQVVRWTGNSCDVVVLSADEAARAWERNDPVLTSRMINLVGPPLAQVLTSVSATASGRGS